MKLKKTDILSSVIGYSYSAEEAVKNLVSMNFRLS